MRWKSSREPRERSHRVQGEHDLARLRSVLRSASVSDSLDAAGSRRHCLPAAIGSIVPLANTLVGYAFPITAERVETPPINRYVGLLVALDAVGKDDVVVVSVPGALDVALWGELLSTSCQAKGLAGVICDGAVRDSVQIEALGFPCFARGTVPYDINSRAEIVGHGDPIEIEGVAVHHGDLVVGDADGITIVPKDYISDVVASATKKTAVEAEFLNALAEGMPISAAFAKFGVL